MRKGVLLLLASLLLFSSCAHKSPFDESEYYFQAMGEEAEIVLTADAQKLREGEIVGENDAVLSYLLERAERISLGMYKAEYNEEDAYPAPLSTFDYYGAFEGNYSSFTINTALSASFDKVKEDGLKYYTNGELSAASPKSGIVLFSTDDYAEAYRKTISDRVIYIPSETAEKIGEAVFALYVRSPKTMIDIGFELPYTALANMMDAVLYVVENGDVYYLYADITMNSERSAQALSRTLSTQALAEKRRNVGPGGKVDVRELSSHFLFDRENALVSILELEMSDAQVDAFKSKIQSITGGLI